jgi:DeoR/GlpR family transcriptional regulator of sugar metabolism
LRRKKDRTNQILELLTDEERVEVAELSLRLGVSQVTIRKDLDELEQRGIIQREHGCAVLRNGNDLSARIAYHYESKKKIAEKACELVQDGDTIMIENGSCCALLADTLTDTHKDLTIITNSAYIASYLREKRSVQVVLLGGTYQPDAQVMVGPMVRQCAENFWVDLFFIGVDGWSLRSGFTNQNQMRAQAVRDMAAQAEKVVVLTESEKFNRHGTVPLNLKNGVFQVITDASIQPQAAEGLRSAGVELITV